MDDVFRRHHKGISLIIITSDVHIEFDHTFALFNHIIWAFCLTMYLYLQHKNLSHFDHNIKIDHIYLHLTIYSQ